MEKIAAGDFEKLATKKSMRSTIVSGALAMVGCEPEDLHLLPSAYLNKMEGIGAGNLEKIATKTSVRTAMLSSTLTTLGCKTRQVLHLLSSANMYLNNTPDRFVVHAPEQWWKPDTQCQLMVYHYKG
ncbi:hypothetical protein SO802_013180 [Lithocarpus litseifolius]|uniref:Uncharacterized protein n=1 Tax=Lithocarpus litseifolius TaxID=425828 RepID=A0AAW2D7M2_9ROSI